jgi:hypothetical protein
MTNTTGQNTACHCGSGKKYKKCHMADDQAPGWVKYRKRVELQFSSVVARSRKRDVEDWITSVLWFFAFSIDGGHSAVTQNKEHADPLWPSLIVLQDLLRGVIAAHEALSLLSIGLLYRTSVELKTNIQFMLQDPKEAPELIARWRDFAAVESMRYHSKGLAGNARPPTEAEWAPLRKRRPYLFKKNGEPNPQAHWTGNPDWKFRHVLEATMAKNRYDAFYSIPSLFVHANPIVISFYDEQGTLNPFPRTNMPSVFTVATGLNALQVLRVFCEYFGIAIDDNEWMVMGFVATDLMQSLQQRRLPDADP